MSEYWKSTPKYWCKHCSLYVRDTKLERANHEATGKHQGAIKRSLRDLHREAEQKEREKDRAKREVERLNGVVSGLSGSATTTATLSSESAAQQGQSQQKVTEAERQRQLEQLAELGVSIPDQLRGHMAMVGEWMVTNTRVVDDADRGDGDVKTDEGRLIGVKRERERTEEEKEQEEAINGLSRTKKPRRWGIDSRRAGGEEDEELEELLSGGIPKLEGGTGKKKEEKEGIEGEVKNEDAVRGEVVKKEEKYELAEGVNKEDIEDGPLPPHLVKKESDDHADGGLSLAAIAQDISAAADEASPKTAPNLDLNAVGNMFKKRKPRIVRQK